MQVEDAECQNNACSHHALTDFEPSPFNLVVRIVQVVFALTGSYPSHPLVEGLER